MNPNQILYRWDLDKTYLRTEFDTVRDVIRIALEPAARKETVPGAAVLLRELRATGPKGISILSGSPEQLRRVVEEKLRLDGIQWDSLILKPSLRQLLRGRFSFVRDQLGYKLSSLLTSRHSVESQTSEILFGDDAEADAFIYSLYADICAGRVNPSVVRAILEKAKVHPEDAENVLFQSNTLSQSDCCKHIFIHLDRMSDPASFSDFGQRVCPFYNYFQPALVLVEINAISAMAALRVAAELVIVHSFSADALVASYMDLVRRNHLGKRAADAICGMLSDIDEGGFPTTSGVLRAFVDSLGKAMPSISDPKATPSLSIDYVALYDRDRARAVRAKLRVLARDSHRKGLS